jgi:hypothetical protein
LIVVVLVAVMLTGVVLVMVSVFSVAVLVAVTDVPQFTISVQAPVEASVASMSWIGAVQ